MQRNQRYLLHALPLILAAACPIACGGSATSRPGTTPDGGGAGGAVDAGAGTGGAAGSAAAAGSGGTLDAGAEAGDATPDAGDSDAAAVLPLGAKLIEPGMAIDRKGNIVGWGSPWDPAYTPSNLIGMKPPPAGEFVDVGMDWGAACAIRTSGQLVC